MIYRGWGVRTDMVETVHVLVVEGVLSFIGTGIGHWRFHPKPDCRDLDMGRLWIEIICIVSWLALCICAWGRIDMEGRLWWVSVWNKVRE